MRINKGAGVFNWDKAPKTLRETTLEAIDATAFFRKSGRARLRTMITNRLAQCISRQRS